MYWSLPTAVACHYAQLLREKNIVKSCVGIGQEHLQVVLKLSDVEVLLGGGYKSEMIAAVPHLNAATALWGKPIILCSLPQDISRVGELVHGFSLTYLPQRKGYQRPQCPCPR